MRNRSPEMRNLICAIEIKTSNLIFKELVIRPLLDQLLMSPSRIIQVFHFVSRQVQCKKNIFIIIFMFLMLHLIFYFYFFSEQITISSSFHISEELTSPLYYLAAFLLGIMGIMLGIPSFFCTGDLCLAYYRDKRNSRLLIKTMEVGTQPEINLPKDNIFDRPIVTDLLKKIFNPSSNQDSYHIICGEHGTGKTTLVRIASRAVGCGVIYVDVPADVKDFGEAFGKAINFAFEERISFTNQLIRKLGSTSDESDNLMWVRAKKAFKRAAIAYKAKHNKPAVIIFDNISRLAYHDPQILDILQDDAKDNADSRTYITVFVSSEGLVPRRMESRSSWSRVSMTPIEIGDLSKEESIDFLVNKRKVEKEEAERLYELVGGRMVDLNFLARNYLEKMSFSDIKQSVLNKVEKAFISANIYQNKKHHKIGCQIINSLLKSEKLKLYEYLEFFNTYDDKNAADEILEKNVFAYHPAKSIVTFQSKSVELYVRTNADAFNVKLINTDEDDLNSNQASTSNQTNL